MKTGTHEADADANEAMRAWRHLPNPSRRGSLQMLSSALNVLKSYGAAKLLGLLEIPSFSSVQKSRPSP
eukprot:4766054-Amphidinium_carterae.2